VDGKNKSKKKRNDSRDNEKNKTKIHNTPHLSELLERFMSEEPIDILCMACADTRCDFKPVKLQRRALGDMDILFDVKYCGVCHSDLHSANGHLDSLVGKGNFPFVPGHELAGVVTKVGSKVRKFQIGDHIGVGCMVDSCLNCSQCNKGEEQNCKKKSTATYQSPDVHGRAAVWPPLQPNGKKGYTLGGYSNKMVVTEQFAIQIPKTYPLAIDIVCHAIHRGRLLGDQSCPYRRFCAHKQQKRTTSVLQAEETGGAAPRRTAQVGDIVTIDFNLKPNGDFVAEPLFDMHGEQTFVLGGGNYLPGIHELIEGMEVGQSVPGALIDAGWGERNPLLIAELQKENFPEFHQYEVGTVILLKTGHKCYVTEKTDQSFTIDCNPPLAGASYTCDLKLLRVDRGPTSSFSSSPSDKIYEVATFGLGCFWGGELAFMREPAVVYTKVGYTQGDVEAP